MSGTRLCVAGASARTGQLTPDVSGWFYQEWPMVFALMRDLTIYARRIGLLFGSALVLLGGVAAADDGVPPGPRLATVELIGTKGSERDEMASAPFVALTTFGPKGGKKRHLLKGRVEESRTVQPFPFFGPTWTGDGSAIAFIGGKNRGLSYYLISADGKQLKRWPNILGPVFSSDGRTIAFSVSHSYERRAGVKGDREYSSTTAWIADLATGEARRLTPWRDGLSNFPTSLSSDGTLVAITKTEDRGVGPQVRLR